MDPTIFTPRLKLTLVTHAERGSPELEWLHELLSNEKSTSWSIHGKSRSIEETEKLMKNFLPTNDDGKTYRAVYAVHKILRSVEGQLQLVEHVEKSTEFIGLVNLKSLESGRYLELPEHLSLPAAAAATTLTVEVAYMFLPTEWGKGYATESVGTMFEACKRAPSFWAPFGKLYVRAIVNGSNPASVRVMEKTGMVERGIYEWTGKPIFLGGQWEERSNLHIFGMHLLEG